MDDPLLRRWVDTWRRAGEELEALRRADLASIDTREAVRHLFSCEALVLAPPSPTSGLVEQQAWFARIHRRHHRL
jgi:hypothetical protein